MYSSRLDNVGFGVTLVPVSLSASTELASWLEIHRPRYTPYAQRSKIVGRVVVIFALAPSGRTTRIRVLEMPHPLLASWAIEAIVQAKPARAMKDKVPVLESDRTFVATFNFEWRWADEPEVTYPSSAPLPR